MSAWMRLNDENISTSKRHKENAAKSEKKLNKKPFGGATRNLKIPPIFTMHAAQIFNKFLTKFFISIVIQQLNYTEGFFGN